MAISAQRRKKPLSTMAILTLIFLAILAGGAIGLFAYQTWEFVNWLFPAENLLMKILAVVNFDIFSYVWLMVGLFLGQYLHPTAKSLAFIVGIVTFVLSLACSVIQMMLAQAERFLTNINPNIVYFAYALVILALVVNIVTVLTLLHIQWPYISGEKTLPVTHQENSQQDEIARTHASTPVPNGIPDQVLRAVEQAYKAGYQAGTTSPLAQAPSSNGNGAKPIPPVL